MCPPDVSTSKNLEPPKHFLYILNLQSIGTSLRFTKTLIGMDRRREPGFKVLVNFHFDFK